MLELFKQEKSFLTRAKEKSSLKYVVLFDGTGAYIEVCDAKMKVIKDIDYRVYNGIDREILQLIENSVEDSFFTVSWENDNNNIYLDKYPKLFELLRLNGKIFIENGDEIPFSDIQHSVKLHIEKSDKSYKVDVSIANNVHFKFLTSSYVLLQDKIVQVDNVGQNFNKVIDLSSTVEDDKLEEFLTIVFTHFENIKIDYEEYKTEFKEETKLIKPAVIFEKVTVDNELILRTSATVGKLSPQFFNDFNISKIVLINELEKSISIYECDFSDVFDIYSTIFSKLNSLKRTLKTSLFSEEDGLFIIEEELSREFILKNLQTIITKAQLFGSEKLKEYNYNTTKPTLNISFKDKIDFLDSDDVTLSIGDETFNIFDIINLYKKHSYIPLNNGDKSIIDKEYISKLERIFKKEGKKVKVSFFDLPEIEELIHQKEQKVFKNSREFYEGFNSLKNSKSRMPKLTDVTMRDYQKDGVRWLKYLYDNNFGGCLADDMGLGKTLQTISLLSYIYPKQKTPSLIVMPKSLLSNWQKELERFNPNLSFYLHYGTERKSENFKNYNIILTTYAIIRNDIDIFRELEF
ncbi:MAG: DEAD/DEAH box helicase, partial [Campylobacterota bacterium]|nr:DEAD/DEAH box helicase [Campylobacterota bacterium]